MSARITIRHDDRRQASEGGTIVFGRTAPFAIGADNQFVHRTVGRFTFQDGVWWLENRAEHLPLVLSSADGARVELPAGATGTGPARAALVGPKFRVQFSAGGQTYVIEGEITGVPELPTLDVTTPAGSETVNTIRLTEEEGLMLRALAQPVLDDPSAGPDALPSNRAVARQLGWPDTKLNRKLDYLCTRLAKQGFQGLKGDLGGEAKLRRWRLVEYAISHGLVGTGRP